jgi:hypothetical protein
MHLRIEHTQEYEEQLALIENRRKFLRILLEAERRIMPSLRDRAF